MPADSRYCGICGQDTHGKPNQRAVFATLTLAQILQLVGFTAGAVAFAGFFVDFFGVGGTTLASANSFWFDLVPITVGISALCVFLPVRGYVVSGLPLIAVGIAFGLRGITDAATIGAPGYGAGFWMIVFGSIALTFCWAAIEFTQDRERKKDS